MSSNKADDRGAEGPDEKKVRKRLHQESIGWGSTSFSWEGSDLQSTNQLEVRPHRCVHVQKQTSFPTFCPCSSYRGGASGQPEDQVYLKLKGGRGGAAGGAGGRVEGIRSRERQYLQARGPEPGAGRTVRRSLSPRRGCPPAPSDEPAGDTGKLGDVWRCLQPQQEILLLENVARRWDDEVVQKGRTAQPEEFVDASPSWPQELNRTSTCH